MKIFWKFFIAIIVLLVITIVFLISYLSQNDNVEYTGETAPTSPQVLRTDPYIGSPDAKVVIFEYSDFQCETCATTAFAIESIQKQFPNDVLVIWKDFPNQSLHPEGVNAAVAARCAGEQNAFWEYHDILMTNRLRLSNDFYKMVADELGLKTSKFNSCLKYSKTLDLVESSYEESLALGLAAPPTIFINGISYTGLMRETEIKTLVKQILEK